MPEMKTICFVPAFLFVKNSIINEPFKYSRRILDEQAMEVRRWTQGK